MLSLIRGRVQLWASAFYGRGMVLLWSCYGPAAGTESLCSLKSAF